MSGEGAVGEGRFGRLRAFAGQHQTSVRAGLIGAVLIGLIAFVMANTAQQPPVHKEPPPITMVTIQPPKPPPPPPPLPTPKIITQPKLVTPTSKPIPAAPPVKVATPKAAPPSPAPMSTSIHSSGPADSFNLAGSGNGMGILGGAGGGGGDAWGYYDSQITTQLRDALQKNPVTRHASAGLEVRIWVAANGTVTRVALDKSSGSQEVDNAVQNQVLVNTQLPPPPAGMPMPITMSLTGEEPL